MTAKHLRRPTPAHLARPARTAATAKRSALRVIEPRYLWLLLLLGVNWAVYAML